jgi:transposase
VSIRYLPVFGRPVYLHYRPKRYQCQECEGQPTTTEVVEKSIHTVCSDMYEGYIEAVREELIASQIVIDRFHVTRSYRDGVDEFRKAELRRLKDELSEEEYKTLKGSLWACRKKRNDLRPEERKVLKLLFQHSPKLKLAYDLQEQLTDIFEQPISKTAAKIKIQAWKKRVATSELKCFDAFLKTLEHWWEEILNYFVERRNSGFVEGFNNKLKVLKRRCYGIFNLKHLFQRIYLDLEGYRLFAA